MLDINDLPIPGPRKINEVNNIICISDMHSGCKLSLCPSEGAPLDDGGLYTPSEQQLLLNGMWEEFHNEWVPFATRGERYCIVVNGDAIEGDHHKASTPISPNPVDQCRIFHTLMEPVVERAKGGLYMVRGTETHVGISARHEELLAEKLGAIPNDQGQHSHWDLWKQIGADKLVHFLHHIGVTGSSAYEATAVGKELVEEYVEAARWRLQPPDVIVRCLSDDTEVLTRSGWRGRDAVSVGEEVLTFNTFTEELQWQASTDKVINPSEPEMVHMTGKGMDILVTPDHNMVVRSMSSRWGAGGWRPMKADELRIAGTPKRNGSRLEIPVSGWYKGTPVPLTDAHLWMIGFIMADGSYVRNPRTGQPYAFRISQQDDRAEEVEKRLREAGIQEFSRSRNAEAGAPHFDYRKSRWVYTRKDCSSWYIPEAYAQAFFRFLDDGKCLAPAMMEMTAEQFAQLLAGFHYGDGATGHTRLCNSNERMLDQLQELFVKHGYKSNINYQDYYTTKRGEKKRTGCLNYLPGRRSVGIGQKHIGNLELIPYSGGSWCMVVPNATLVTRHNGAVAIVGNSHRHRNYQIVIPVGSVDPETGRTITSEAIAIVTPGWQLKTPHVYKIPGGRISQPQFGGICIRVSDDGVLYAASKVWTVQRSRTH